jgi:hypothetical protein
MVATHTPEGRTCAMNKMGTGNDCLSWCKRSKELPVMILQPDNTLRETETCTSAIISKIFLDL